MAKQLSSDKVSVDIYRKDKKFFANVDFTRTQHALGPASTRDEIYYLVFHFIADLQLVSEINQTSEQTRSGD